MEILKVNLNSSDVGCNVFRKIMKLLHYPYQIFIDVGVLLRVTGLSYCKEKLWPVSSREINCLMINNDISCWLI